MHRLATRITGPGLAALLAAGLVVMSGHALGQTAVPLRPGTAVIDDSATVVLDSAPAMTWRSVTPKNRDNAIIGRTRVNVRLATAPWLGKAARIYMVLPTESSGSAKVAWRSHGLLLDGQLVPGGRALVYAGTIRDRRMEDVLDVQIEADGTRVSAAQQLRFHFEIDVE
jgi:hypothetical protein